MAGCSVPFLTRGEPGEGAVWAQDPAFLVDGGVELVTMYQRKGPLFLRSWFLSCPGLQEGFPEPCLGSAVSFTRQFGLVKPAST